MSKIRIFINIRDKDDGISPLMAAVGAGRLEVVRHLVKTKMIRIVNGQTPISDNDKRWSPWTWSCFMENKSDDASW